MDNKQIGKLLEQLNKLNEAESFPFITVDNKETTQIKAPATVRESVSGLFVRSYLYALHQNLRDKARNLLGADAPTGSELKDQWSKIKGRASDAEWLLNYLKSGRHIPSDKEAWIVNGQPVKDVTLEYLPYLIHPMDGDAGIRTLIKAARKCESVLTDDIKTQEAIRREYRQMDLETYLAEQRARLAKFEEVYRAGMASKDAVFFPPEQATDEWERRLATFEQGC